MADAIQLTVPDNDFVELLGAGAEGSVLHQGGAIGSRSSTIALVESASKPVIDPTDPNRFKSVPISIYLHSGKFEPYNKSIKIWAMSQSGDQLLSITPA